MLVLQSSEDEWVLVSGMHRASGQSCVTLAWRTESCTDICTVPVSGFAEALLYADVSSTADSISALIPASHPQTAQASQADPAP